LEKKSNVGMVLNLRIWHGNHCNVDKLFVIFLLFYLFVFILMVKHCS